MTSGSSQVERLRRWIALSATCLVVGLGVSVLGWESLGGVLTVVATGALVWTIHRLGRTGPDPA